MTSDLAGFLARHTPLVEESAVWGDGTLPLRIRSYLGDDVPPLEYVTSVRCLVFRDESILVLRNADSTHIVPGGRREGAETLEATLHREVLEETGWTLAGVCQLGFRHFRHLGTKPPGYAYPFPDFVQVVYMADAAAYRPEAILPGDYELEAGFRPVGEVQSLALSPGERLYLEAALERRAMC